MDNRRGVLQQTRSDQYIAATIAADGTGRGAIGPCPEGFEWYVERLTCSQTGTTPAATALLEIYVLPTDLGQGTPDASKQGRQDVSVGTTLTANVSDQESPIVVPAGYYLVAYWTGLTSGDKVALSTQVQVRKLVLERAHRHSQHDVEHHRDVKASDIAAPVVVGDQVAEI